MRFGGACMVIVLVLAETDVSESLKLKLIHTSEISYKIKPFDSSMRPCLTETKLCIGGVTRLSQVIKTLRGTDPNILVVDSGSFLEPNYWYAMFGTKVLLDAVTSIGYDAMSPALNELLFNTFTTNKKLESLAVCANCINFPKRHVIIKREGVQIGIIGFISFRYNGWSKINSTNYKKIIREEIDLLVSKNVNIIILLSHSSFEDNVHLADLFYEVDIVVGGHSGTLLFNGIPPGNNPVSGPYPLVIEESRGVSLIAQVGNYGKFLGTLDVFFDDLGMLRQWTGNPVYMDDRWPEDPVLQNIYAKNQHEIEKNFSSIVGSSFDFFDHELCLYDLCPLAYRLCEALLDYFNYALKLQVNMEKTAHLCMTMGYFFRKSLYPGNITRFQLRDAFSFNLEYVSVKLVGKVILEILEKSASFEAGPEDKSSRIQPYGLKITYNNLPKATRKIKKVSASKCFRCKYYAPFHEGHTYWIVVPKFFVLTDNMQFIPYYITAEILDLVTADVTDMKAMERYLSLRSPIYIPSDPIFHDLKTKSPEWFPEMWLSNRFGLHGAKYLTSSFSLWCAHKVFHVW